MNFFIFNSITVNQYLHFLEKWFLIGLTLMVVLMFFVGLMWYFRKIWSSREDTQARKVINSSVKWMIFSWIGILTIDIILLVIYNSVWI